MTDVIKQPIIGSVKALAFTGVVSATTGSQLGESMGDIVGWTVMLMCKCNPPLNVLSAFHSICTALVVIVAFFVHYWILKFKQREQ